MTLVNGTVYTIEFNGQDIAGNQASTFSITGVTFDTSPPVFSNVSPSKDAKVKTANVGYTLDEQLASGSVTFTRTDGATDNNSPHTKSLTGNELNKGTKALSVLTNAPTLVDGAIYTIAFNGQDAAGNQATTISITGVTFDTTPPKFTNVSPLKDAKVKIADVGYTLDEQLASGSVTFTRTDGPTDNNSPHTQSLAGNELNKGTRALSALTNAPTLVDGAIYKLSLIHN